MKTIFVFLATGFEEIEALTPVDVLRRAGLNVQTVSVMDEQTVVGAHGIPVVADKMIAEINSDDAEMILLPGGLPGATNLDEHAGLSELIMNESTAPAPLATKSLKDSKPASVTPMKFTRSFPAKAIARENVPMSTTIFSTLTLHQ